MTPMAVVWQDWMTHGRDVTVTVNTTEPSDYWGWVYRGRKNNDNTFVGREDVVCH